MSNSAIATFSTIDGGHMRPPSREIQDQDKRREVSQTGRLQSIELKGNRVELAGENGGWGSYHVLTTHNAPCKAHSEPGRPFHQEET